MITFKKVWSLRPCILNVKIESRGISTCTQINLVLVVTVLIKVFSLSLLFHIFIQTQSLDPPPPIPH